jgi:hypothetical protein
VERYRTWFKLFWLRGDAAFAKPEIYVFAYDVEPETGGF